MFKNKNEEKINKILNRLNKSKGKPSKKPKQQNNIVSEVPQFMPINSLLLTKQQAWLNFEITSEKSLRCIDKQKREKIMRFIMCDIGPAFQVTSRTLEHTIKLLDIYLSRKPSSLKPSQKNEIYPDKQVLINDLLTCFFMSCKYNEIYSPMLRQVIGFCQTDEWNVKCQDILENEMIIFKSMDMNMNMALVSDWWKITNKNIMPCWAYLCYLDFDLKDKSLNIFKEINHFVSHLMDSTHKQRYIEFIKESEASWNVKQLENNQRKAFHEDCFVIYNAFVEFRVNKELSKMSLLRSSSEIKCQNYVKNK